MAELQGEAAAIDVDALPEPYDPAIDVHVHADFYWGEEQVQRGWEGWMLCGLYNQQMQAEKGKTTVVHEDPIIEAVRRAISGGGPVIRDGGHQANDQARVAGQIPPRVPLLLRPKREFRQKHPAKLWLHPDEPIGSDVMGFDDKMRRCSGVDKLRKWYCHTHPYTVQLTGAMIEAVFDREGDPEVDHMIAMWWLLRKEEAKLFRGLAECFRVIPDFRLGEELMEAERSSDLDFDYIATMITEEHTGVRIEVAKNIILLLKYMESWAVYNVDLQKKVLMVMEPVEAEEPRHEMEAKHKRNAIRVLSNLRRCIHKHKRNAIRVLSNLRRCIHECIPGTDISSVGWKVDFNTGMQTCCERDESWIYGMHYLREYTDYVLGEVTCVPAGEDAGEQGCSATLHEGRR